MEENEISRLVLEYCERFNVPVEYLFEILEDQKVTPMIRGKATEYNAFIFLDSFLSKSIWSVQKLNLNAQTGTHDEDISITHRRTGIILKVESKNATRGSANLGVRTRIIKQPHFKVKCHRSRSSIALAATSNDRYSEDSFDIIISNPINSMYQGNTVSEYLELIKNDDLTSFMYGFYKVSDDKSLINALRNDWVFAIPKDIAVDGFVPRTPYVKFYDDENWFRQNKLEANLLSVVKEKRKTILSQRR